MTRSARWTLAIVGALCLATAFAPDPAAAQRRIRVHISSNPPGTTVYLDSEEGKPLGTTPVRDVRIARGNHTLIFKKEGYESTKLPVNVRRWRETFEVVLDKLARLQLTAGNPGAQRASVTIDGEGKGPLPINLTLGAGRYLVEVKRDGHETFRQWVEMTAGETLRFPVWMQPMVQAPIVPTTGSLRVVTNVDGALVSVDGELVGPAPIHQEGILPGEHIVEVSAEGHELVSQTLTVEAGKSRAVSILLTAAARPPGRIVVNSKAPGARVFVDGQDRGSAPIVVTNPAEGPHAIVVRAPGHEEYRQTCEVGPGKNCDVEAPLKPIGAPVRVETNASGAMFVVDGEARGPVPWEGTLPVGSHRIEIVAEGYRTHTQQIRLVTATEPRTISANLVALGDQTEEEQIKERRQEEVIRSEAVSHDAAPLAGNAPIADFSIGWPYTVEGRLGIRILDWLEGGVALRTFGRVTEFEGRAKIGKRFTRQVAAGVIARFGGGLGLTRDPTAAEEMDAAMMGTTAPDHPTNTVYGQLDLVGTLHFAEAGAFSLWTGLDFFSDRWDWTGGNSDVLSADSGNRQNGVRWRLGGVLEISLNRHWNLWGLVEGVLAGDKRRIWGDIYGFGTEDTLFYFRLGATYKF